MTDRAAFPVRLRRRLAIMFVLVAGLSAGALALGAAVTTQSYRVDQFNDRAQLSVQRDLRLLAAGAPSEIVAARLRDRERPGGSAVIVIRDDEVVTSVDSLRVGEIPPGMRERARQTPGTIVQGDADLDVGSALVLGTVDEDSGVELYFFFPREELQRGVRDLRTTLAVGWVVVVAVAALFGTFVARRALRPVRSAADAARSVAEGILDTRLPVVRADDEFGEWAASFNRMVAALEEKIHALAAASEREKRFTADVAHELRTPLSAVLAAASHLEARAANVPPELAELHQLLAGAARRLDRLTSELLELHRLEGGQEELHIQAVDLATAIAGATAAHGWRDRVRLDAEALVVVETDRHRFDRIIVNLVANALQHGGTDARVHIGVEAGHAVVSVSDDGPGIRPEDLPHVFERHFKGSRDRAAGSTSGGSGLGLSIAQESAQRLGGSIAVASSPGAGATFVVRLPLQRDEDERDGEQRGDERAEPVAGGDDATGDAERAPAQQRVPDREQ